MIKSRAFALWFLILFVAAANLSRSAGAQDSAPSRQADPAALPFGGSTAVSLPAPDHIEAVGDWSMLAYQKLQGDYWDIYVHDKSGPRRLTSAKGDDQQPSLDRGAKRVAFTSDRSGDTDLYTINVDGTGLRRILDTKSTLAFPTWSPDGQHIVLQSIVDGQYEIYIVNADGSSPQRLTNNRSFDGMPAWSPDGKQLAFASNRSGDYRIHVMNADGSGVRRLSSLSFSLHPTWSPDGRSIAFDADVDGDGWQELAIIEAGGARERMIYDAGNNVTAWAGSWSPDNQALSFTEITAVYQGGAWIWVKGVVRKWDPAAGTVDLIPGGREWYTDWQTKDAIPPQTTIDPLPPFSRAEDFMLRWSGVDYGGSGLNSYAVYYNEQDGGGWHTYLAHTSKTQAPFPAKPGTTVEFLIRATDNAHNRETWQPQNTEQTTFFNTIIAGTVTDNRGNPLSGVPIESSPALPLSPLNSGQQGHFTGYTVTDQDHTISIQELNFKATPPTKVAAGSDFLRHIYLQPQDNLIRNGTFEQSASTPTDWISGGLLPVAVSSEDAATGRYAVRLGQTPLTQGQQGLQNTGTASISQVVTVPAAMQGPTLSYMVRAAAGPPVGNTSLRVFIQPVKKALPVEINKTLSTNWTLNWIDMTPWLGQKVVVTFEMIKSAGDPLQAYFLDDISIGSANPDLWAALASGPAAAIPGEPVAITLDFGNRGPIAAENVIVELGLPAEIALVSATPPYSFENNVLRWDITDLPAHGAANRLSIVVTPATSVQQTVTVKALIHSDTAEAHLRNNVAETRIQIAKSLYLPVVPVP